MGNFHIFNARIVNENETFPGSILIEGNRISKISRVKIMSDPEYMQIDAKNGYLIPGIIDDQVHFREPGLTHKADIASESKAALAGGITSFMEMPNTSPQTVTINELEKKFDLAATKSYANYSFYLGATNDNINEIKLLEPSRVCGVKIFMGASTGNMLVDKIKSLEAIFSESPVLVATHCEDESIIQANLDHFRRLHGDDIPINLHPKIRSAEACYKSSSLAVSLAEKYNARLHVLHISTGKELELFDNSIPLEKKKISAEVCVHHLWFNENDYESKGSLIKWNPAIKTEIDRKALFEGLLSDKLDVVATDHAPHTLEEKSQGYLNAPSGAPMVQHSLNVMMEFVHQGLIPIEKVVEKMCHAPAKLFQIENRGFIREGYYADITIINDDGISEVNRGNVLYKCGWSPLENQLFHSQVTHTFVNGELAYCKGEFNEKRFAMPLSFKRS
jgi:dihydroorotase